VPTRTLAENSHRQKQKEEETAAAGAEEEVGTAWGTVLVVERELAVEVRPTANKGLGVFACEACEAMRWICNYEGELLTEDEVQARRLRGPCDYVFETCDSGLCIDGEHSGHWSCRINHDAPWSCNCFVILAMTATRPVVRIHTKRSIAPGEELTIDYGDSYWRHLGKTPVLSTTDRDVVRDWLQSELDSWSLKAGIITNVSGTDHGTDKASEQGARQR
jgi:hypothetical protein